MATIQVTSEDELVEAVRGAREDGRRLEIAGRGTKRGFGRPVEADDMLDLSGLSGIVAYEPEELVLTARAGTPLAEIEAALGEHDQRLGFDPADWGPLFGAPAGASTIAGALSADTSGSARARYGAARDHLLGFRAVNGFAEAYKAGGRVVKNVTGFDLAKLMCGAMGTLGPLSEVTLRLVPRAPRALTLAVKDMAPETGLALVRRVWATPLEATGLAFVPAASASAFEMLGGIGAGAALIRVDGTAEVLAEKRAALRAMFDGRDAAGIADGDAVFARLGAGAAFVDRAMDVWRIAVPPSEAAVAAQALAGTQWFADWAGGLFWVGMSGTNEASAAKLRHIAWRASGQATLVRADAAMRATLAVFPPEQGARAGLTRAVKSAFDPQSLFNPGRMFEDV
jgi:glycolate oxidase FAD binding subunit